MTVAADKILTVAGNFTIKSDASGTGSFLQDGTLNVVGNTIVQKYLPNTTTTGWTLAIPVKNATNSVFTGSPNIWFFNPAIANWQSFAGGTLNQMTGYVVRFPSITTVAFSGALNNGDMLRNNDLMRYTTPNNNYGWNYVGNPYPSPIDWDNAGITKTNVDAAVYFRKADGSPAYWVAGVGNNGGTNIIPAMQAFWVRVTYGQTSGSLKFTNAARLHGLNNSLKSAPNDLLSLNISNDSTSDETVIRFKDGATDLYDSDFDAVKMYAYNSSIPQIYSLLNNEEYAINALPISNANVSVPLGFKTHNAGNYKITASNLGSFNINESIVLEDLYDNVLTDLNQQNTYIFNAAAGTSTDRFIVHFNPITTTSNKSNMINKNVNIYSYNNAIYIANVNDKNATVTISDLIGREVLSQRLYNNRLNKVNADFVSGQYLVKVISDAKITVQKVYLNNVLKN